MQYLPAKLIVGSAKELVNEPAKTPAKYKNPTLMKPCDISKGIPTNI